MSRWKASGIHLLISLTIVGSVAAYIVSFWYPPALFQMARADMLLMLVGGIDLIIGPLLTLVIYRHNKPGLRFDLIVIAILQAAFLSYGLYTMYLSRPVFLVASAGRFDLVFANEISSAALAEATKTPYGTLGIGAPKLVGADLPQNQKAREAIMMSAFAGNGDLQDMPRYYTDYATIVPSLLASAKPLKPEKGISQAAINTLIAAAKQHKRNPDDVRWLRLGSSRGFAVMLVEAGTGKIIGPVNADP